LGVAAGRAGRGDDPAGRPAAPTAGTCRGRPSELSRRHRMLGAPGDGRRHGGGAEAGIRAAGRQRGETRLVTLKSRGQAPRRLGASPLDFRAFCDIESSVPGTGLLRFIEVKGRARDAKTVTITKNEIFTAFYKPDEFILAIGLIDGDRVELRYLRRPFHREPD